MPATIKSSWEQTLKAPRLERIPLVHLVVIITKNVSQICRELNKILVSFWWNWWIGAIANFSLDLFSPRRNVAFLDLTLCWFLPFRKKSIWDLVQLHLRLLSGTYQYDLQIHDFTNQWNIISPRGEKFEGKLFWLPVKTIKSLTIRSLAINKEVEKYIHSSYEDKGFFLDFFLKI